jgi:transposase
VALEPTGDYHRPLANFLLRRGHHVHFVSSIACNRTGEALYNSWDKNDSKDAQVILHLLKGGVTQRFSDPLEEGTHDLQELLGTYRRIVDRKVRVYNTLMTHYLPLYFPEAEAFVASSRSEWFLDVFLLAPLPADVLAFTKAEFIKKAVKGSEGHPTVRRRLVGEYYESARKSVGIPVLSGSVAMEMFRLVLEEYIRLAKLRRRLEKQITDHLDVDKDYQRLRTIPGIGPIVALTILAEGGNLRRFSHHRKFLKFCGFDLSTSQSGAHRGVPHLSKRGNAQLRCAFWMAGRAAVAQRRNGFRKKFDDYVRADPKDTDLKRKAYTAVAAKMARVAYGLIKTNGDYRHFRQDPM